MLQFIFFCINLEKEVEDTRRDMNLINLYLLVAVCGIDYAVCWLDVLRTLPIANAKHLKKNATHIVHGEHVKLIACRKDRHCKAFEFCHRYERNCIACRTEGQMCRRNKMCCRSMECVSGKCRKKVQLGRLGALCSKDRDCNYGFCCARENGQSICKPLLHENETCGIPKGGRRYLWSHQCPCAFGLKCKKVETKRGNSRSHKLDNIMRGWNNGSDRRCVKPKKT